jgi:signal transduction histidine kinase
VVSRARLVDTALTAFFVMVVVIESFDTAIDDGTRQGPPWVNALLGVLLCLPVLVRGPRPVTAYVAMALVLAVPSAVVPHELFSLGGLTPVLLVTWSFARHRDGWFARLCWLPPAVLPALTWSDPHGFVGLGDLVLRLIFVGGAVVVARTMRRFAEQGAELRRVLDALSAQQEAGREAAVAQERTRIAAEMHDVVAHAVSAMVVQVGAARMEGGPEQELAKLRSAEATGHRALEELRTTLGLLRGADDTTGDLRPLPGLDALEELALGLRAAGFEVDLRVHRSAVPRSVPESVALATYRILQEAFTNALKHGARGRVLAEVDVDAHQVSLRVQSPLGRASTVLPSGGHGLAGMRERVALFGGRLDAGVHGDHYLVEAILQLDDEPALT